MDGNTIETDDSSGRSSVRFRFSPKSVILNCCAKLTSCIREIIGGEWMFLALLGVSMALCSFAMDYCIEKIQAIHLWLYWEARYNVGVQYTTWVVSTLVVVLFSVGFCHMVAPQAIGSGIPELKTILRGVVLQEYLSFRTLISKIVGLTLCLGSGLPIGKEGPFVHVSSIMVNMLSQAFGPFRGIYENESRKLEMLVAACAVGVACTFGAPIGGVLFSIEVTSVYFAVRNYWRAFFAATWSSIIFRLAAVWFNKETTIVAFNKTSFETDFPFDAEELFIYAAVGRFLYPAVVTFVISSLTFPAGYGQFISGASSTKLAISDLFSNFSWSDTEMDVAQAQVVQRWSPMGVSFFVCLTLYALYYFFSAAIASTLPVPSGIFIPVFAAGAAIGRIVGEFMYLFFPNHFGYNSRHGRNVVPGSYAIVGAAAFSGSVTHTVSTGMIVFELTGQIVYIVPVMLAVLISNAIASYLQPSFYDSVIRIKKLPYLPHMLPTGGSVHNTLVEEFMVRDVKYVSLLTTYRQLQDMLIELPNLNVLPLVDNPTSLVLLGSIPRPQLELLLDEQVGEKRRKEEAQQHYQKHNFDTHKFQSAIEMLLDEKKYSGDHDERRHPRLTRAEPRNLARFEVTPVSVEHLEPTERRPSESRDDRRRHNWWNRSPKLSMASDYDESLEDVSQTSPTAFNELSHTTLTKSPSQRSLSQSSVSATLKNFLRKIQKRRPKESAMCDFSAIERTEWEQRQLDEILDFEKLQIDNAPFQLMEHTSLYKTYSIFSLLGLRRAYVTGLGRLIGVVSLDEIRRALEKPHVGFKSESKETQIAAADVSKRASIKEGFMRIKLQPIRKSRSSPFVRSTPAADADANTAATANANNVNMNVDDDDDEDDVDTRSEKIDRSTTRSHPPLRNVVTLPEIRIDIPSDNERFPHVP